MSQATTVTNHAPTFDAERQRKVVQRAIARGSFCTLATSSARNRPHVAGVVYAEVDGNLYINTLESSVKARNIRENNHVAVCIPVRKFPFGPPYLVHFQGTAEVLSTSDPHILALVRAGRLKSITSHGELELPGSCFIRITPSRRVATHGLGVPLLQVIRDPITAGRSVELR
jgi:nitroimidazol reductase NimA-like FMN-containing flavoprotein (pyridoxamine 5'-phosphate oxidase superfamily)